MLTQERSVTFSRRADVTYPDDRLAWADGDGLMDLTDWTLSMEIVNPATNEIQYTKTTGIVGNDGTTKTNLIVAWEPAEMEPLAGRTRWLGRIIAAQGTEKAEFTLDAAGSLPVWIFEPVP